MVYCGGLAWGSPPQVGGCPVFPADNIWNTAIHKLPVSAESAAYIQRIGPDKPLHPDFGDTWRGAPAGIPFLVVSSEQAKIPVLFRSPESDQTEYPIPNDAPIEAGGDRHVLIVERDHCVLYELFDAWPLEGSKWKAGSGAVFQLQSNELRRSGWTSADAAGLPILPGLVRYEELAAGEIRHALRFTAPQTQKNFVWPARHHASKLTDPRFPPMGQRFRLKQDVDITRFSPEVQVILRALKVYGMMLADNGKPWFVTGAPDRRWRRVPLHEFRRIRGWDFEAVDVSPLLIDPDSAQARQR